MYCFIINGRTQFNNSLCVVKAVLASAAPILVSTKRTGLNVNTVPSDAEEDNTEDEASAGSTAQPGQESLAVAKTTAPVANAMSADGKGQNKLAAGTHFGTVSCTWLVYNSFLLR